MKKVNLLVFLATGIVLALLTFIVSYELLSQPSKVAEVYVRALAAGDAETFMEVSSGGAAYIAARLKGTGAAAEVEDVSVSVAAFGRGWAKVLVGVDLMLGDGSADAGYHGDGVIDTVKLLELYPCLYRSIFQFV